MQRCTDSAIAFISNAPLPTRGTYFDPSRQCSRNCGPTADRSEYVPRTPLHGTSVGHGANA